jgi:hypothetical protein
MPRNHVVAALAAAMLATLPITPAHAENTQTCATDGEIDQLSINMPRWQVTEILDGHGAAGIDYGVTYVRVYDHCTKNKDLYVTYWEELDPDRVVTFGLA